MCWVAGQLIEPKWAQHCLPSLPSYPERESLCEDWWQTNDPTHEPLNTPWNFIDSFVAG